MPEYSKGTPGTIGTPAQGERRASASDLSGGTDGNLSPHQLNAAGALRTTHGDSTVFKTLAALAVTAGTKLAVWTPATGKKFRLKGWDLSCSTVAAVLFCDSGASNAELVRTAVMQANTGKSAPPGLGDGLVGAAANGILTIDVTATCTVNGFVYGIEE